MREDCQKVAITKSREDISPELERCVAILVNDFTDLFDGALAHDCKVILLLVVYKVGRQVVALLEFVVVDLARLDKEEGEIHRIRERLVKEKDGGCFALFISSNHEVHLLLVGILSNTEQLRNSERVQILLVLLEHFQAVRSCLDVVGYEENLFFSLHRLQPEAFLNRVFGLLA